MDDLAELNLAFYHKECIDAVTEVKRKVYKMADNNNLKDKDKY